MASGKRDVDKQIPIDGLINEQFKQFANLFAAKNSQNDDVVQPMANMTSRFSEGNEWVVDSGCTEHITHTLIHFCNNLDTSWLLPVTIPNGDSIHLKGKGTCTLPNETKISDGLYVPNIMCNILLLSRLIRTGSCKQGLYRMNGEKNVRRALATTGEVWHKRLRHASHGKLSQLDFFSSKPNNVICDSCARANFTRLPFPTSSIKSNECFDLLHYDIWGKYRTPSLTRANYFPKIIDDFSRSVWAFLL
uniref:Retrovirus-related Pol polyprotein from transposon TNT 1-94-like beta-barrel domain-containing protein n=1 Tax=Lactuca sativa TaxID=4236 RepID=A0A9R1XGJ7_LACSA|nr:hypothetical protein LSAT_V11C400168610 [Lactuca sativa]